MTILITGATGFLGRHTVAALRAKGIWVRALVRPASSRRADADEICEGDLREPDTLARAVAGVDGVVHAGARVSTTGNWRDFEAVNVRGTADMIRVAAAAGVRRIVHVSSLSVYAVPKDGAVIGEEDPYDPGGARRGFYARSKLEADRVACGAMREGAPVVVVRPGLLYGPGKRPPLARRAIALGPLRLVFAAGGYLLPLAYVENVADAICLAVENEKAVGRAYTIVDAHVRQADHARRYRRLTGGKWVAVYVPPRLSLFAATLVERLAGLAGRTPPLTRHQVERTVRSATFDATRAERELGWQPRVPLEEALRLSLAQSPKGS